MDTLGSSKQIRSKRTVEVRPRQPRKPETTPRKQRAQEITLDSLENQKLPLGSNVPKKQLHVVLLLGRFYQKPGSTRVAELRQRNRISDRTLHSQSEMEMCAWAPRRYLF
jgi:hypothetical protein